MLLAAPCLPLTPYLSFALQFDEMECLENDDHSRTFLCASVAEGKDSVCLLISIVDDVLEKFGKPQFYEVRIMQAPLPFSLFCFPSTPVWPEQEMSRSQSRTSRLHGLLAPLPPKSKFHIE
jgi:hypothetical protein